MSSKLFDFTDKEWDPEWNGKTIAVSIHTHSDQSLDGGSSVESMMDRAVELGYSHFTLSEHGNINSAAAIWEYSQKLKKKGKSLKPFHSVEGYIRFPEDSKETHITIGFKTSAAYEYYCKLTPKMFSTEQMVVKFGDVKPVMTIPQFEELAQYGITVGTGCIGSWLNRLVMAGDFAAARKRLDWMISIVGIDNIYDEWIVDDLSKTYVKPEYDKNRRIIKEAYLKDNECYPIFGDRDVGRGCNCARKEHVLRGYKIKPIASLDAHYARKADKIVQDAKNYGSDWVMSNFQHLKGAGEFAHEAKKNQQLDDKFITELIENTHEYASQFNGYEFKTSKNGWMLPRYELNDEWVWSEIKKLGLVDLEDPVYLQRLKDEIDVFNNNGVDDFLNYVRLVREIVQIAESEGILCNVRGSAGGSLVYYALGISVLDPIKFDLPFERHLTKDRIGTGSLPDADLDFSNKTRMFELLRDRYGDRFIPLSVDSLLKPRSAIKDAERALLGYVRQETEVLTKLMPNVPQGMDETDWLFGFQDENGEHHVGFFEQSKELQDYAKRNVEIWELVVKMCGIQRQKSGHACGILVSPEPVQNRLPVYRIGGKDGDMVTGFNPKGVEFIGGVKIDILGVKKMETIQRAADLIREIHGVDLKWGEYPHDLEVFKSVYWTGKTEGTFQTSTPGITALCVKTKPVSVEDLSNLIALYRPSCLDASPEWDPGFTGNLVDYYVAWKQGGLQPKIVHPDLIPIVGSTAGSFIFQEQLLRTFRDIGGMTYAQAEIARRAVGKKDAKVLAEEAAKLKSACLARGWSETQAEQLVKMVMASARYGFNKAHSASYAVVSYNTAYLKHKYPLEFWAAELSCEHDNEDKLRLYSELLGSMILQPDILKSHPSKFLIEGEKLRAPLSSLKGVGESVVMDIQSLLHNDLDSLGLVRRSAKEPVKKKGVNVSDYSKQDDFESTRA